MATPPAISASRIRRPITNGTQLVLDDSVDAGAVLGAADASAMADATGTGPPHPVAGYPSSPHTCPSGVDRSAAAPEVTCRPFSVEAPTTHFVTFAGGVCPSGATAGVPKSITTPTRFWPAWGGVESQIAANEAASRGGWLMSPDAPALQRQPITDPSAGVSDPAPTFDAAQVPSAWPFQYDQ